MEGLLRVLRYGGARPTAQHAAARLLLDMASTTEALAEELVCAGAVPVLAAILCDASAAGREDVCLCWCFFWVVFLVVLSW